MENQKYKKYSVNELLKFILPSLIGFILFIIPIPYDGEITIPIAVLSKVVLASLGSILPQLMGIIICITFILYNNY